MSILLDKSAIVAFVLVGGGTLVGCSITPQQQLMMDMARCQEIGFPSNSIPMAECVQRYELDRNAEIRARQAALDHMLDSPRWSDWPPYRERHRHRHHSW